MRVTVRLFATYRELAGTGELTLDLDEDSVTVGDALRRLADAIPGLAGQRHAPLTACNLRHVTATHRLRDGDELAIFPPVSGG